MTITASPRTPLKPRGTAGSSSYAQLLRTVRDAGLLRRRRSFYITLFAALALGVAGPAAGFVRRGDSCSQLLIAGVRGVLLPQLAFLPQGGPPRKFFKPGPANDRAGRFLANAV